MASFPLFLEFGIIIIFSTFLAFLSKYVKQPPILAYIVSGLVLGASFLNFISANFLLQIFSELGIAFLLFLVGLNLNPKVLREQGFIAIATGLSQIAFTAFFGFLIAQFFGFAFIESLYIAIALTFSSTIIIVKYLSDKKEINSLHGRVSIGFLLVQDFVAILILLFVSSLSTSFNLSTLAGDFIIKGLGLFLIAFILSKFVIQPVFRHAAESQEILFLSSISWCLFLAGVSEFLGFSIEIGAFLAGVSIAFIPYNFEIGSKLKILRDFFLVLFFVSLGSQLALTSLDTVFLPTIIFSLFILIGNPLIVIAIMLFFGFKARTSFFAGLTVAQISEFSLILVNLGSKVGHVSQEVIALVTFTGVITISATSFLIYHSGHLFDKYFFWLKRFERKQTQDDSFTQDKTADLVFFGFGETGKSVFKKIGAEKEKVFVFDFDPQNFEKLKNNGFNVLFADAQEPDVIEKVVSLKPKTVFVSTDNFDSSKTILMLLKQNVKSFSICVAQTHRDAKKLYDIGADFVIIPKIASSEKIAHVLQLAESNDPELERMRRESIEEVQNFDKEF